MACWSRNYWTRKPYRCFQTAEDQQSDITHCMDSNTSPVGLNIIALARVFGIRINVVHYTITCWQMHLRIKTRPLPRLAKKDTTQIIHNLQRHPQMKINQLLRARLNESYIGKTRNILLNGISHKCSDYGCTEAFFFLLRPNRTESDSQPNRIDRIKCSNAFRRHTYYVMAI